MKDEEFKEFDHEPAISYLVTGEHPFDEGNYFSEEVYFYTFDEAIGQAKIFSERYHDVYITKQFMYTYQWM